MVSYIHFHRSETRCISYWEATWTGLRGPEGPSRGYRQNLFLCCIVLNVLDCVVRVHNNVTKLPACFVSWTNAMRSNEILKIQNFYQLVKKKKTHFSALIRPEVWNNLIVFMTHGNSWDVVESIVTHGLWQVWQLQINIWSCYIMPSCDIDASPSCCLWPAYCTAYEFAMPVKFGTMWFYTHIDFSYKIAAWLCFC